MVLFAENKSISFTTPCVLCTTSADEEACSLGLIKASTLNPCKPELLLGEGNALVRDRSTQTLAQIVSISTCLTWSMALQFSPSPGVASSEVATDINILDALFSDKLNIELSMFDVGLGMTISLLSMAVGTMEVDDDL